jgi:predicted CoA-substrate-specific enzyme activase
VDEAMGEDSLYVAGVDVGTECVKAVILDSQRKIVGRSVVPTGGYFQDRIQEALNNALDEAQVQQDNLTGLCATGFGSSCVTGATMSSGETACHALGTFHYFPQPMCVVDIGGRDPKVIHVGADGRPVEIHALRRCAVGIGTFLMFASRHLDVHPTRLEELATAVDTPASVGSYCSIFAGNDVLDRLREGVRREEVALGCIHSVAQRVVEIGSFKEPMRITGGVVEFFPGVVKAFSEITQLKAQAVPEPIQVGALGAALRALSVAKETRSTRA